MTPNEKDLLLALQGAKLESVMHLLPGVPGVDTMEEAGMLFTLIQAARVRATEPLRVAEVGCYAGRLTRALACSFLRCPDDVLFAVDTFKGLRDTDPDALSPPWSAFRAAEVASGIDFGTALSFNLHADGTAEQVKVLRGNLKSLGETLERQVSGVKLDLLIFNNLALPYDKYLEVANAWLPHLRKGSAAVFFSAHVEAVAATVRELITRRWPAVKQGASGTRAHVILVRPLDETTGSLTEELNEDEDAKEDQD